MPWIFSTLAGSDTHGLFAASPFRKYGGISYEAPVKVINPDPSVYNDYEDRRPVRPWQDDRTESLHTPLLVRELIDAVNATKEDSTLLDTLIAKLQLITEFFTNNSVHDERQTLKFLSQNRSGLRDLSIHRVGPIFEVAIPSLNARYILARKMVDPDVNELFKLRNAKSRYFPQILHVFRQSKAQGSAEFKEKHVWYLTEFPGLPVEDRPPMSLKAFRILARDVASALETLHEMDLMHVNLNLNSIRSYVGANGLVRYRLVDIGNFRRFVYRPKEKTLHLGFVARNIVDFSRLLVSLTPYTAAPSEPERMVYFVTGGSLSVKMSSYDYNLTPPQHQGVGVTTNSRTFNDLVYVCHRWAERPPRSMREVLEHPFLEWKDELESEDQYGDRWYKSRRN